MRRLALGGELGGPKQLAWGCSGALIFLWATYIASSIWRNASKDAEAMIWPLGALALISVLGGVIFEVSGKFRYDPEATKAGSRGTVACREDAAEAKKGLKARGQAVWRLLSSLSSSWEA